MPHSGFRSGTAAIYFSFHNKMGYLPFAFIHLSVGPHFTVKYDENFKMDPKLIQNPNTNTLYSNINTLKTNN